MIGLITAIATGTAITLADVGSAMVTTGVVLKAADKLLNKN